MEKYCPLKIESRIMIAVDNNRLVPIHYLH